MRSNRKEPELQLMNSEMTLVVCSNTTASTDSWETAPISTRIAPSRFSVVIRCWRSRASTRSVGLVEEPPAQQQTAEGLAGRGGRGVDDLALPEDDDSVAASAGQLEPTASFGLRDGLNQIGETDVVEFTFDAHERLLSTGCRDLPRRSHRANPVQVSSGSVACL